MLMLWCSVVGSSVGMGMLIWAAKQWTTSSSPGPAAEDEPAPPVPVPVPSNVPELPTERRINNESALTRPSDISTEIDNANDAENAATQLSECQTLIREVIELAGEAVRLELEEELRDKFEQLCEKDAQLRARDEALREKDEQLRIKDEDLGRLIEGLARLELTVGEIERGLRQGHAIPPSASPRHLANPRPLSPSFHETSQAKWYSVEDETAVEKRRPTRLQSETVDGSEPTLRDGQLYSLNGQRWKMQRSNRVHRQIRPRDDEEPNRGHAEVDYTAAMRKKEVASPTHANYRAEHRLVKFQSHPNELLHHRNLPITPPSASSSVIMRSLGLHSPSRSSWQFSPISPVELGLTEEQRRLKAKMNIESGMRKGSLLSS